MAVTSITGLEYGTVSWATAQAVVDGFDADALPDLLAVNGVVTFTPSAPVLLVAGSNPPATLFAQPVTCSLKDGVLADVNGNVNVSLLADGTALNPQGWTWKAEYRLNDGLSRGSFSFHLAPGQHVDLTTVAPVGSSNGTMIIAGPKGDKGDPGPTGPAGSGGGGVPATTTTSGTITLAGDLGGTASAPTVPGLALKANTSAISTVGKTGAYTDLTGKPALATVATSGLYSDLTGKPVLATVATSGSYADLTNKPTIPAAYTDEQAQDATAALLAAGTHTNITFVYDDAGNRINATVTASSPTLANMPAGTTITVLKSGGVWPARPTSRTDIVVAWKGADPSPSIVASGTGGMLDNVDYRLVTP